MRSCEGAYNLLQKFSNSYQTEVNFLDDSYGKLNNLTPIKAQAKEQLESTKVCENNISNCTNIGANYHFYLFIFLLMVESSFTIKIKKYNCFQ